MPDTSLEQRAAAFLALAEKATLGPWMTRNNGLYAQYIFTLLNRNGTIGHFNEGYDSLFSAAARNDAPALVADLLAEVRRLRGQ